MLNMFNAASAQALEEGKKRLRDFLETSETGRSALGVTGVADEYELQKMRRDQKVREEKRDDDAEDEI